MFDLFYSTRKGGTGLGLAIANRIARTHEAEIVVESQLNQGTTVRIALPQVSEEELSVRDGFNALSESEMALAPEGKRSEG